MAGNPADRATRDWWAEDTLMEQVQNGPSAKYRRCHSPMFIESTIPAAAQARRTGENGVPREA